MEHNRNEKFGVLKQFIYSEELSMKFLKVWTNLPESLTENMGNQLSLGVFADGYEFRCKRLLDPTCTNLSSDSN